MNNIKSEDFLFVYWANRKIEITEYGVMWRGRYCHKPDALHKAIDDQLESLRPHITPSLSSFDRRTNRFIINNAIPIQNNIKNVLMGDKNSSMFEIIN